MSDIDDKDLDAFLAGDDELSRQLKALPQGEPSAELDAAILKRVKFALAQEKRPVAANDPAPSRMGAAWRWTAGIAATVLAGVLANHALRESREMQAVVVPVTIHEPKMEAAPEAPPPAPAGMAVPKSEPPVTAAMSVPAPPPPPPPLAAPAPPVVEAAPAASQEIETMNRRVQAASPYLRASAPPSPAQQLATIETDLQEGRQHEALAAWRRFRTENPDYPVPPELADKLNALKD